MRNDNEKSWRISFMSVLNSMVVADSSVKSKERWNLCKQKNVFLLIAKLYVCKLFEFKNMMWSDLAPHPLRMFNNDPDDASSELEGSEGSEVKTFPPNRLSRLRTPNNLVLFFLLNLMG